MVKDGNRYTVMLANKSAIYSLDKVAGMTEWVSGTVQLAESILNRLADGAAKTLGRTVLRVWHDHKAGGAFAEIEVAS